MRYDVVEKLNEELSGVQQKSSTSSLVYSSSDDSRVTDVVVNSIL